MSSFWGFPWCLSGEYDVTHFPNDRLGVACTIIGMMEFFKLCTLYFSPIAGVALHGLTTRIHPLGSELIDL